MKGFFFFYLTGEHRMQFWKCVYLTWPCRCRIWPGSSGCGKSLYILIHTPSYYVYLVDTERYWWMHGISLLACSLDTSVQIRRSRRVWGGGGGGRWSWREGGREKLLKRYDVINICPPKTRCVRAKMVLTGYFDRRQPQSYFKAWVRCVDVIFRREAPL